MSKQEKIKKVNLPGGGVSYEVDVSYHGTDIEVELLEEKDQLLKKIDRLEDIRDQAMATALSTFEKEKELYAAEIRKSAGDTEAQRFLDRVTSPDTLEAIKSLMPLSREMFKIDRTGTTPGSPPQGSQVDLNPPRASPSGEYESYAEMVDDLRTKAALGDKQAVKDYNAMWGRVGQTLKKLMMEGKKFPAITGCPKCGRGIVEANLKNDKCPFCGVDVAEFRRGGGSIF